MYITILEGQVKEENWSQLEKDYESSIRHAPDGLAESFLIHCLDNRGLWKIISVWKDEETYHLNKALNVAKTCEQLFCDAGTTPHRTHFHVRQKYTRV